MPQDSFKHSEAMSKAIDLHRGAGVSASDLVETAEMIRLYCEGKLEVGGLPFVTKSADGDATHEGPNPIGLEHLSKFHQSHIESALALTLAESSFLYPLTTFARQKVLERVSSLLRSLLSQVRPEDLDAGFLREKILLSDRSGKQASNSSSVQDGESVGEVATPSRTETVVPDGGSVTDGGV